MIKYRTLNDLEEHLIKKQQEEDDEKIRLSGEILMSRFHENFEKTLEEKAYQRWMYNLIVEYLNEGPDLIKNKSLHIVLMRSSNFNKDSWSSSFRCEELEKLKEIYRMEDVKERILGIVKVFRRTRDHEVYERAPIHRRYKIVKEIMEEINSQITGYYINMKFKFYDHGGNGGYYSEIDVREHKHDNILIDVNVERDERNI